MTLSAGSHVQGFLVSEIERNFENGEKLYDNKVVQNERIHFFLNGLAINIGPFPRPQMC